MEVTKDFLEKFGRDWEQFKQTNDARLEAIEKGDTGVARELAHKLEKIESEMATADDIKAEAERVKKAEDRLASLEAGNDLPGRGAQSSIQREYKSHFEAWIRSQGQDVGHAQAMKDLSQKDVSIGTASAGGHAMPEVIAREIERLEAKLSAIAQEVKTVQVGTNDYKELVDIRGATAAWSAETGTRSATVTPELRQVAPTMGEQYAYVTASDWSLDDIFFSVEEWLTRSAAEAFALGTSSAVWDGDGSNKPTGMINTAPVATDDDASPLRAAAAYEFTASAASPDAILPATVFDLVYLLNAQYLPNAKFAANRTTWGAIRQLADSQGQYLWQPGLQAGEPNQLVGYPTFVWENMESVGANTHPLAFGDFRRAYVRPVRRDIRVTVDNVTAAGFVKFYIRRREGGIPLNNDALKFLKTT